MCTLSQNEEDSSRHDMTDALNLQNSPTTSGHILAPAFGLLKLKFVFNTNELDFRLFNNKDMSCQTRYWHACPPHIADTHPHIQCSFQNSLVSKSCHIMHVSPSPCLCYMAKESTYAGG